MILRTELVDQVVDGDHTVTLVKDVVMTSGVPLGMVRKRLPPPAVSRGAVMLIHGFGQNRYTWHIEGRSFSAYLAEQGFDVFNVDLRGHGRSGEYSAARPHAVEQYVREDMPSFVREAIRLSGHERVFLVGHSMGGLISYASASSVLRDYVQGIVTIGSPYRFGDGSGFLAGFSALAHALRFTGVFDSNPRLPLGIVGHQFRALRGFWDREGLPLPVRGWHPGTIEPHLLDRYLARAFDWTSLGVLFDVLKGGNRVSLRSRDGRVDYALAFESLNKPLLAVAGEFDLLAPPDSVESAVSRSRSRDKRFRMFPLGHIDLIVGREATCTVWPLIGEWLTQRSKPRAEPSAA
jgi:pimeloyl-ACP methyl ester carboxylesterase